MRPLRQLFLFAAGLLLIGSAAFSLAGAAGTQTRVDEEVRKQFSQALEGLAPKAEGQQEPPELAPLQPVTPLEPVPLPPIPWTGQVSVDWKLVHTPPAEEHPEVQAINWATARSDIQGKVKKSSSESTTYHAVVQLVPATGASGYASKVGTLEYTYTKRESSEAFQPIYCRNPGGTKPGSVERTGEFKQYTLDEQGQQGKAGVNLVGGDTTARVEWTAAGWVIRLTIQEVELKGEQSRLWHTKTTCEGPKNKEPDTPIREPLVIKSRFFEEDILTGVKDPKAVHLVSRGTEIQLKDAGGQPYPATVKWQFSRTGTPPKR